MHQWSKYQLAIFDAIENSTDNLLIKAYAGSSKTTVIKWGAQLIPPHLQIGFFAFNKSIKDELLSKLPRHIDVQTMHSYGFKSLLNYYGNIFTVQENKTMFLLSKRLDEWEISEARKPFYLYNIQKAVDLCRMNTIDLQDPQEIESILSYYDIPFEEDMVKHIGIALKDIAKYNRFHKDGNKKILLDFTDMVHLPATDTKIKCKKYDVIFVDEVQDLNRIQQDLIIKALKPLGRLIAVGDVNQSIYTFAGADGNSFDFFAARPDTISLPLPISYRCSQTVIKEAKKFVADIEPFDGAEEGSVRIGSVSDIKEGCFVLCRTTKPLIVMYYFLIKQEIPSFIRGREIGEGLVALLKPFVKKDKEEAIRLIKVKIEEEKNRLREKGIRFPERQSRIVTLEQNLEIVEILFHEHSSVSACLVSLESMFSDDINDKQKVCLSSIHKAKGLEADVVILIHPEQVKEDWRATQLWHRQSQRNIAYVAITRARKHFITIPVEKFNADKVYAQLKSNN